MPATETSPVEMLKSFARDEDLKDAPVLSYPDLEMKAQEAKDKDGRIFNEFSDCEMGSVEEEGRARAAAVGNLVLTGLQLQHATSERRAVLSSRLTEASIELYGEPDQAEVTMLVARELKSLESYIGKPGVDQNRVKKLIDFYSGQLGNISLEVSDQMGEGLIEALDEFKTMLEERYAEVFKIFDEVEESEDKIQPEEAKELVEKAIGVLAESEAGWDEWKVEIGKTRLGSSDSRTKTIKVGTVAREPKRLKAFFGHEALVHSLRAINGNKTGSNMAEHGLPNYLDAEEGVTTFVETAISGKRDARTSDIYMNTGFALGSLDRTPLNRHQLQELYLDKLVVAEQAKGKVVDTKDLTSKSWSHVNRIYRGSLGNEFVAVSTKDIAYYQGFIKVARYIQAELKSGREPGELFDYLVSAKFDPTNERHVEYLKKLQI